MKAYQQEHKVFTDATCMDVLQDFFKYAIDEKKVFTRDNTTCEDNCLYVEKINGLAPRTISGCMDGWSIQTIRTRQILYQKTGIQHPLEQQIIPCLRLPTLLGSLQQITGIIRGKF